MIDETILLKEINDFTSVVKGADSDYMKGYINALQAVRGMITAQLLAQKVGGNDGRSKDSKERQTLPPV